MFDNLIVDLEKWFCFLKLLNLSEAEEFRLVEWREEMERGDGTCT
jgi:hypothetical protein